MMKLASTKGGSVKRKGDALQDGPIWPTLLCLGMITMMRGVDSQMLPATFRAMEANLDVDPLSLAWLALCQGVASAIGGPFWGDLVECGFPRRTILILGTTTWAFCSIAMCMMTSMSGIALLRVINGLAVSMVLPVCQAFAAELCKREHLGVTFGSLHFWMGLGDFAALLLVTPLSNKQVFGNDGWRVAWAVNGSITLVLVALIPVLVREDVEIFRADRFGANQFRKLAGFLQIPTFAVIVAQGLFGTIPSAAASFLPMYLQYLGISDFSAALVVSMRVLGECFGGLLGGFIGDSLNRWSPAYGRVLAGHISVTMRLLFNVGVYVLIPREASMVYIFAIVLFLEGLLADWAVPACLCPIMCDIVPKSRLASAYAWEVALVFTSGNVFGHLLVGELSESLFSYKKNHQQISAMTTAERMGNADALGRALFYTSVVPGSVSAVVFALLYRTYQSDSRQQAGIGSDSVDSDTAATQTPGESTRLLPTSLHTAFAESQDIGI